MTQAKSQLATTTTLPQAAENTPAPRFLPLETIAVSLHYSGDSPRDPLHGIVANMSETGACYILNRYLPPETLVTVDMMGTRTDGRMQIHARVIWCAERIESVKEIVGYMTGVAFREQAAPVRELLESGLFQIVP